MSLAVIITFISVVSGIIPVLAGLYNYKYLDKILKTVFVFFIVSALFDLIQELLADIKVNNDLPLIHLFILISVAFYAVIYYHAFFNTLLKKVVVWLSCITGVIVIVNAFFVDGIWGYPSVSNTIVSILLLSISLAYFYQLLNRAEFIHIEKQGLFWINAGVLFYYSLNIFLFMLLKQITRAHLQDYFMIHDITNIIANLLFTTGLLCRPQKA